MIRSYVDADLEELLQAWYEASLLAHPFLSAEFLVTERVQIAEHWLPASETFVYELDGVVVGFLSLVDDEVGAIFVHPDQQGRGIGRTLMDHAATLRTTLELDVFEQNPIGRGFYDAYGFAFVSARFDDETGQTVHRLRLP